MPRTLPGPLALALTLVCALPATGCDALSDPEPEGPPPEVAHPYDEAAHADADIATALSTASAEGKRVLLVFGGNWCPWCRRLEHTLQNDSGVSRVLRDGFVVVHIDTGARRSGKNAHINERYGDPIQHGLPVLVVLDAEGEVVTVQETGSLEVGDRHDPEKVRAFLERIRG